MKASEVRAKSGDELREQLLQLKKEQFNLRFQKATGQLENTSRVREVRRDIARIKTILAARACGRLRSTAMPRRVLQGTVVSDKADKTIIVRVDRRVMHPLVQEVHQSLEAVRGARRDQPLQGRRPGPDPGVPADLRSASAGKWCGSRWPRPARR